MHSLQLQGVLLIYTCSTARGKSSMSASNNHWPNVFKTEKFRSDVEFISYKKGAHKKFLNQAKVDMLTGSQIWSSKCYSDKDSNVKELVSQALSSSFEEQEPGQENLMRDFKTLKRQHIKSEVPKHGFYNLEQTSIRQRSLHHSSTSDYIYKTGLGAVKTSGSCPTFFSIRSFKDIGSTDYMIRALKDLKIFRPSHIQAMSYSLVCNGENCIIAEQSGTGKTLAYLAPLVQRLREKEIQDKSKSLPNCPRVLILVPTADLAVQVLHACRALSRSGIPFRSIIATGGFSQRTQLQSLDQSTDVLIATPGRFEHLLARGRLNLKNLLSVVLDEVDSLFKDDGFSLISEKLVTNAAWTTQHIFVTATLPVDVHRCILETFPDCKAIFGPGLHHTCSGLEEILVDCSGDQEERNQEAAFRNKKVALLKVIEQHPVQKTVIFCHKIESCRRVENALKRQDRKARTSSIFPFHGAIAQQERITNLRKFYDMHGEKASFLICTDRASRGLDVQNVEHVVLFDFPEDPTEYVRRVGRTARAGATGKAFIFVVGNKQVSLARRLLHRNNKGHPHLPLPLPLHPPTDRRTDKTRNQPNQTSASAPPRLA